MKNFCPPLSSDEVKEKLYGLGIRDDDFIAFYNWKNGQREDSYCEMIEYGGPFSIEEIYEAIAGYHNYDPMLVPLISEGEQMLLFNKKPGNNYGKIYFYSVPQLYSDFPISYYDSITSMIETTIVAYKKGLYIYDFNRNKLRFDYYKLHDFIKSMNPQSKFWTDHNSLNHEEWYEI